MCNCFLTLFQSRKTKNTLLSFHQKNSLRQGFFIPVYCSVNMCHICHPKKKSDSSFFNLTH